MVMGDRRSKEDYVHQIDDIDRLVKNLCTIWFGRMRLHANVVRFQRTPMNKRDHPAGAKGVYKTRSEDTHKDLGQRMKTNSYAGVVKQTNIQPKLVAESEPALVLDNSYMLQRDFSMSLMGKVKEFSSISNLPVVLAKEGFENLKISYLGGCWVLIDFKSNLAKENFQNHTRVGSWFALLQQAYKSFHIDERVTWVDIEGVPLQAWTQNTFVKIASKWGEFIYVEDNDESCLHTKRLCIKLKSQNNIFETFKIIAQGKVYWIRAKETSGWVPEFMEEKLAPNESDDKMLDEDLNMMDEAFQKETKLDVHSDEEEVPESSFVHELMHANDDEQGQNNIETPSVGYSSGLLCVWDLRMFKKDNVTTSDYFVAITGGLVDVPLGGYDFTWSHRSASKMSKFDRFLISEGVMLLCLNISTICLDRYLSDHRPSLLRESFFDYGPSPFRIFHFWFELDGFDNLVEKAWNDYKHSDDNAMTRLYNKLRHLKQHIRIWIKAYKVRINSQKRDIKDELTSVDLCIDQRDTHADLLFKRKVLMKSLQEIEHLAALEIAQKSKIGLELDMEFPNILCTEQTEELERNVSIEEIKQAFSNCGVDKSPGPAGFTFGFYRRFWNIIHMDVVEAVKHFFQNGFFPRGSNSSFIALIPKMQDAKMVKDFRPITLIVSKVKARLSKGKMKTLSIGGRLTLLKLVLASIPIYHLSMFKVPAKVLHTMESIRSHFFNGAEINKKKMVSMGDTALKEQYPRVYSLETCKSISVANKLAHSNVEVSLRRPPRGGVELHQYNNLSSRIDKPSFLFMPNGEGRFTEVSMWCDIAIPEVDSYDQWLSWFLSQHLRSNSKIIFKGIFYIAWWHVWNFRNKTLFGLTLP
ncbi:RNA-directed DNA polymerase, eukaryota [Tanacetum coccineum]